MNTGGERPLYTRGKKWREGGSLRPNGNASSVRARTRVRVGKCRRIPKSTPFYPTMNPPRMPRRDRTAGRTRALMMQAGALFAYAAEGLHGPF